MTMPDTTKFTVDVHELLEQTSGRKVLSFVGSLDGLRVELARVDEPMTFDLTLDRVEDGIVVRGPLRGRFVETCRRCLAETVREFSYDASEVYRTPTDVWEEGYVISPDETIDLRVLVRDTILPSLPLYPVCHDECAGLCPSCGTNRNADRCDCDTERVDLRWSALKDLL